MADDAGKEALEKWVVEALKANGGEADILTVARHVWEHHQDHLRGLGNLFYTWQYDMRWAATSLREKGIMRKNERRAGALWKLA